MDSVFLRPWPSLEDPEAIFGGGPLIGFTLRKKLGGARNGVGTKRPDFLQPLHSQEDTEITPGVTTGY